MRNYNLSKYEELKQKYNDDSNTLYWNNKNLMVTEKYVYIYKIKSIWKTYSSINYSLYYYTKKWLCNKCR